MTRHAGPLLALACATTLAGCISLFPKSDPVTLYRFGQQGAAQASASPAAGTVAVFRSNGAFQAESAGDRMLTVTNEQTAYIAESRWVAPASVLFNQAVLAAFDADTGRARLISRGEPASADYLLRLDVRNFETRYENGPDTAPVVLVRLRAAMSKGKSQAPVADRLFEVRQPASENRVSAIVAAYDTAMTKALGEVVAWTNAQAAPG